MTLEEFYEEHQNEVTPNIVTPLITEDLAPHIFKVIKDGRLTYMIQTEDGRIVELDRY